MNDKCWGHRFNHIEGCEKKLPHGPHIFPEPPGPVEGSIKQVMTYLAENSCEFSISHNPHHGYYETIADYLNTNSMVDGDYLDWAIEHFVTNPRFEDELWVMQIYPRTPVVFTYILQDNFEGLIRDAFKWLVQEHLKSADADNPPLPEYGPMTEAKALRIWLNSDLKTQLDEVLKEQILFGGGVDETI